VIELGRKSSAPLKSHIEHTDFSMAMDDQVARTHYGRSVANHAIAIESAIMG